MATLNVKGFPDDLYALLQEQAKRHRRSVAQEVTRIIADAIHQEALRTDEVAEPPDSAYGASDVGRAAGEALASGAAVEVTIGGRRLLLVPGSDRRRLDELPRRQAIACTPDELVATSWEDEWSPGV